MFVSTKMRFHILVVSDAVNSGGPSSFVKNSSE